MENFFYGGHVYDRYVNQIARSVRGYLVVRHHLSEHCPTPASLQHALFQMFILRSHIPAYTLSTLIWQRRGSCIRRG